MTVALQPVHMDHLWEEIKFKEKNMTNVAEYTFMSPFAWENTVSMKTIELNDNSAIKNAALWPESPQVIFLQVIPVFMTYSSCV